MRQDGSAEFISASLNEVHPIHIFLGSVRKIMSRSMQLRPAIYLLYSPICQVLRRIFFYVIIKDKKVRLRCAYVLFMSNLQIF